MRVLILTLFLAAASYSARPPWEKNHLRIGQALYRENCVVCHDIDGFPSKKPGPSFYQLFKNGKMPLSNAKPNREYIKVRVKFGGPLMPAFRQSLTEAQIDTLIDYIESKSQQ
ncbi:MAG TPA: cytochrome c [Candidatus Acidoferrales bacterium]|nr:cytochrome c [Candidatus Acidoferrales bacterium]